MCFDATPPGGGRFTKAEARRLKEKAEYVKWRIGKRKEYFALFSMDEVTEAQRKEGLSPVGRLRGVMKGSRGVKVAAERGWEKV